MLLQGYKYIILITFIFNINYINGQPSWSTASIIVLDSIDTLSFTVNDNNKFFYYYHDEIANDSINCEQALEKRYFYRPIRDTFQIIKHVVTFQHPKSLNKIIIMHKMHKMEIEIIDPPDINWYVSIFFEEGRFILDCKSFDPLYNSFDKPIKLKSNNK